MLIDAYALMQSISRRVAMLFNCLIFGLLLGGQCGAAVAAEQLLASVDMSYFGLVMSRSDVDEPWPSVRFGSWRLWDAYVTWPYLEPAPGKWEFAALDRKVVDSQSHGVNLLLVLGQSPAWASARPAEKNGYKPGFAAEPTRISDWHNYVETVARRYKGRIKEYQIWNEPSDKTHYTGSVEKLVELTCEAYRILKAVDPSILVVSPPSSGGARHVEYLDRFLMLGGRRCIDVVAHHLYVPRLAPEATISIIQSVKAVMRKNGVADLPLWCTEVGWWIEATDFAAEPEMVARGGWRRLNAVNDLDAFIQRTFLIARSEGVSRLYWYAWNNRHGWSLTTAAKSPKAGVRGWNAVVELLDGRRVEQCSYAKPNGRCTVTGARVTRQLEWQDDEALVPHEGASFPGLGAKGIPH
jgi:hypothetical protein